jgi:aquaglyceroporin related protein
MGGVVGAGLVYSQYIRAIDIFEGARSVRTQATASFFSSYAVSIQTTISYR